jgi:hypothetical protein
VVIARLKFGPPPSSGVDDFLLIVLHSKWKILRKYST